MICPSCNKFAGQDVGEPEVELDVENGIVTGNVRVVVSSACCGAELKEANLDVEIDLESDLLDGLRTQLSVAGLTDEQLKAVDWDGVEYSLTDESAEAIDDYETTNKRTGKPIPPRSQTHYYGAEVDVTVEARMAVDGKEYTAEATGSWNDRVAASGMDELV